MRRRPLVLAALLGLGSLLACAASGSSAPDEDDSSTTPTVDAGKTSKPVPGATDSGGTVDDAGDDATADAGVDAGKKDGGVTDGGAKDSGVTDSGVTDSGIKDAGPKDAGFDAGDGGCAFNGVLVEYDMAALSGSAGKADPTLLNGVSATAITRVGVMPTSATGGLNASNWPTATSADAGKYFTLSITAPSGCAVATSSITVDLKASGTGPTKASIGTSSDAFTAKAPATVTTAGGATTVAIVTDTAANGTLEIRIYGYDAGAAAGTMRVDNLLTVQGNLH